jgi:phage terminase small subunit
MASTLYRGVLLSGARKLCYNEGDDRTGGLVADDLKPVDEWTDKQRLFVDKYFELGMNATRAAIAAGYSRKTARSIGHVNMTKDYIRAEINRRLTELAMGADEVLARLADHGRGDMREFIGKSYPALARHPQGNLIKKVKRTVTTHTDKDGDSYTEEKIELELYDAQAALNLLGRHHKLFTDKHEYTGKDGEPLVIAVTKMDIEEL